MVHPTGQDWTPSATFLFSSLAPPSRRGDSASHRSPRAHRTGDLWKSQPGTLASQTHCFLAGAATKPAPTTASSTASRASGTEPSMPFKRAKGTQRPRTRALWGRSRGVSPFQLLLGLEIFQNKRLGKNKAAHHGPHVHGLRQLSGTPPNLPETTVIPRSKVAPRPHGPASTAKWESALAMAGALSDSPAASVSLCANAKAVQVRPCCGRVCTGVPPGVHLLLAPSVGTGLPSGLLKNAQRQISV